LESCSLIYREALLHLNYYLLILAFFVVALVYSSVGFGGGSSYLALLAMPIFTLSPTLIRPTALMCNLIVVTSGCIIFYRSGKLKWKDVWPYIVLSVPLAYFGGRMKLSDRDFFLVLAITLIIASFFLWFQPKKNDEQVKSAGLPLQLVVSGGVGFLSGLVSIGGGIFLSPILHFFKWNEARVISGIASVYILVNSISGLWGQFSNGIPELPWEFLLPLLGAVLVGGQIGSRLGAKVFNVIYIKRITAVLILVAGVFILREHW
jgi:uncharacterized membrane protein YfcA